MAYFFPWVKDFLEGLSGVWNWLITPIVQDFGVISYFTTPISILSLSGMGIILIFKLIHMLNPLN